MTNCCNTICFLENKLFAILLLKIQSFISRNINLRKKIHFCSVSLSFWLIMSSVDSHYPDTPIGYFRFYFNFKKTAFAIDFSWLIDRQSYDWQSRLMSNLNCLLRSIITYLYKIILYRIIMYLHILYDNLHIFCIYLYISAYK